MSDNSNVLVSFGWCHVQMQEHGCAVSQVVRSHLNRQVAASPGVASDLGG